MKALIVVLSVSAMAMVPISVYAVFRPAPIMDRIVYVPMPPISAVDACNAKTWPM